MLHNETPEEWKKTCYLYKSEEEKDKYGYIKTKTSDEKITLELCVQPVSDEALIKEFGLDRKSSIETVVYDSEIDIEPLYILACDDVKYRIKGIKKYMSYRLVVAERIK